MAFPPQKPKRPGGPPMGGPPQGPPDPFAPQGGPPMPGGPGAPPMAGMGGPPDPFAPQGGGMPPPGLAPGMPKPGASMDPMQAMMNGIQPPPDPMQAATPGAQGLPLGPDGLPVGGQMPQPGADMGGSDLLTALQASLSGGESGDPYDAGPLGHGSFQGMGPGDPSMGIEQLLQMLALGKMGVGGDPMAGSSGVDFSQGNPGQGIMM